MVQYNPIYSGLMWIVLKDWDGSALLYPEVNIKIAGIDGSSSPPVTQAPISTSRFEHISQGADESGEI